MKNGGLKDPESIASNLSQSATNAQQPNLTIPPMPIGQYPMPFSQPFNPFSFNQPNLFPAQPNGGPTVGPMTNPFQQVML